MSENHRIRSRLSAVFNGGFLAVFSLLLLLCGVGGFFCTAAFGEMGTDSYPIPETIGRYLLLLFSAAAIGTVFFLCDRLLSRRAAFLDRRRTNTAVILIAVGLIFALQLSCAFLLRMHPITDLARLEEYASQIIKENSYACIGSDTEGDYILRYQNNLNLLLILTFVDKLEYLLTGSSGGIGVILLNTIALNLTTLLTVLTSRRVFGMRRAVYTLLLCALFAPYYTFTAYYYTDSLSVPFVAGTLYVFAAAVQSRSRVRKAVLLLTGGVLCALGFEVKGSVVILLIAVLIYLPLQYGVRRALRFSACFLLGFALIFGSVKLALNASSLIPKELSDRYRFPATHWVMVGLNGVGGYTKEDADFTASFPSVEEKTEANLREIENRITEKGFGGMVFHVGRKLAWTWTDGTYYIANYLANYRSCHFLHRLILYDGDLRFPFYAYSCGYQLFLITMAAVSALSSLRRRTLDFTLLLRIAVFGLLLFFLIWETNARYLFHFTPLLLLLATDGVHHVTDAFRRRNKPVPVQPSYA